MSNTRCVACERRKGRRACPALAGLICPTCCGTKRLIEITCAADCAYLATAQHHPPAVVQRRHEREARFLVPLIHDLSDRQQQLFLLIQSAIARHRPATLPPLTDLDVADAASALAATLETERRGIIYEHHASSLPAQRLEQDLIVAVESHRKNGRPSLIRDLVTALRRTERASRDASRVLDGGDDTYLNLVERTLHENARQTGVADPPARSTSRAALEAPTSEKINAPSNSGKNIIVP